MDEIKLRDYVIEQVNESSAAQQERIKDVEGYVKRYEAKRSVSGLIYGDDPNKNPKTRPWFNCSDVGIPIDAFTVEGLMPRFMKVCFGANPIVWVRGTGESDQETAPIIQQGLNYQLTRLIKIYRRMKLIYKTVCLEGDAFAKCLWENKTRPVNVLKYYLVDPLTEQPIMHPETGEPIEVTKNYIPSPDPQTGILPKVLVDENQEEKVVYDGPWVYGRTIRNIIVPKNAISPEIEEWDWIADTYEETFDFLKRREGDIKEGKFKNINKIREKILEDSSDHAKSMKTPIKIAEWYGRYDINDDDKDEEIIVFVATDLKILLGWMLSPFPQRPFFHYQIIPMEGRPFGKGVPEFLLGLRAMVDAIFNQMIDRGSINNNPPIITPTDHDEDLNPFGPGVKWKTDNSAGYKVLDLPKSEQMEFEKMNFLLAMVQKLFGITDYALGQESTIASNRTATGIMSIIGEGNVKFDDMIRALQDVNEDLYNFIVLLNADNLEDDFIIQLTEQGVNPFKAIKKSYWGGNYDYESVGNSVNINRAVEQERAIAAYTNMVNSYGKNPAIGEETMIDVTKNFFTAMDIRNVRIKAIEQIQQEKQQQAQLAQQMMAMEAQGANQQGQ